MSFSIPSFDELLNAILTDYKNQFPDVDISQGSLVFIKSACLASALWGAYRYQEWVSKQIFPDTADSENLQHHAWVWGLTRKPGESDADLLARLLDRIRRPPAGGNKYDYIKWALEVDNVTTAHVEPLAQGPGTVDIVITATYSNPSSYTDKTGTNTAVATNKLIDSNADFTEVRAGDKAINNTTGETAKVVSIDSATQLTLDAHIFPEVGHNYTLKSLTTQVWEHIDSKRPVTAHQFRVLAPSTNLVNVAMTVSGSNLNLDLIHDEIYAYVNGLGIAQPLYRSQLIAIALQLGAENATVEQPASDVIPMYYEIIKTNSVVINEA